MATIDVVLLNETEQNAPSEQTFNDWLKPLAEHVQTSGEVCIKIVSIDESQHLNKTYREKDKPTNVLSFPSDLPDFVDSPELGDLAICAQVVEQEAQEQNKVIDHHWAHLCIHGVLHLLGYDHVEEAQAEQMEQLEIELLQQLGIPNPYVIAQP